jgi:hypothetical protein
MNANMMAQLFTDVLIMAIWRRGKPEPLWECLGQCCDGVFLFIAENRKDGTKGLSNEE